MNDAAPARADDAIAVDTAAAEMLKRIFVAAKILATVRQHSDCADSSAKTHKNRAKNQRRADVRYREGR